MLELFTVKLQNLNLVRKCNFINMKIRGIKLPKYVVPISAAGTVIGLSVLFRDYMSGASYTGEEQALGRTIIVTGANCGMGRETSMELARRGARVIMACRNMSKCEAARSEIIEETYNRNVVCKKLDLASMKSIRDFARDFNENEKRLDVLVNNAGVMGISNRTLTEDGFEMHMGVNYLGHFLLTHLVLDKLKASAPSRIVTISSVSHTRTFMDFRDLNAAKKYDARQAYLRSKLASILFMRELGEKLKGTGVTTYSVHPGIVKTNLGRNLGMKSDIHRGVTTPFWSFMFKTPVQGIQTALYCMLHPEVARHTGRFYSECESSSPSAAALNDITSKRLYAISERWTQLVGHVDSKPHETDAEH